MKAAYLVATAALVAGVFGAALPDLVFSPNKADVNTNPHRRPVGPVYGKVCKTEKGVELCPRCVKVIEKECQKFEYFTPDDAKAAAWDAAKTAGDSCALQEEKCAGEKGYEYFKYKPCCKGFVCAKKPSLGWGRYCLPEGDVKVKTCTKNMQQCEGAKDKDFIDYAPCCSADYECVLDEKKGWGKFCVPKESDAEADPSPEESQDEEDLLDEEDTSSASEMSAPATVAASTTTAEPATAAPTEPVTIATAAPPTTAAAMPATMAAATMPETTAAPATTVAASFGGVNLPGLPDAPAPSGTTDSGGGLAAPSGGLGDGPGFGAGAGGLPSFRQSVSTDVLSSENLRSAVRNMRPHGGYEAGQRVVAGIGGAACTSSPAAPQTVAAHTPTASQPVFLVTVSLNCPSGAGVNPEIAQTVTQAVCMTYSLPAERCRLVDYTLTQLAVTFQGPYTLSAVQTQLSVVTSDTSCPFQRFVVQNAVCGAMAFNVRELTGAAPATTAPPAPTDSFGCRTSGSILPAITTPGAHPEYDVFGVTFIVRCAASGRLISAADGNRMLEVVLLITRYDRRFVAVQRSTNDRLTLMFYIRPEWRTAAVEAFAYYFNNGQIAQYLGIPRADLTHTAEVLVANSGPATPAPGTFGCRAGAAIVLGAKPAAVQGYAVYTTTLTFACANGGTTNNADARQAAQAIAAVLGVNNNYILDVGSASTMGISYYGPPNALQTAQNLMNAATTGTCALQTSLGLQCADVTTQTTITVQPIAAATPSPSPQPTNDCRVRRDCRALSTAEWNRYAAALVGLQATPSLAGRTNRYEDFVAEHAAAEALAHGGPQFLPWHRYFLKAFEDALRTIDPTVTVCYWDWTVDQAFPGDSAIWGLFGATSGSRDTPSAIQSGAFTNLPRYFPSAGTVQRAFTTNARGFPNGLGWDRINGVVSSGYWPTPGTINAYIGDSSLDYATFERDIENIHGVPHNDIGADMRSPSMAPNDPIFFSHHAYIDAIWARWQNNGNRNKYNGNHRGQTVSTSDVLGTFTVAQLLAQSGTNSNLCVSYGTGPSGRMAVVDTRSASVNTSVGGSVVRQGGSPAEAKVSERCQDPGYQTNAQYGAACVAACESWCRKTSGFSAAECAASKESIESKVAEGNNIAQGDVKYGCGAVSESS